MAREYFVSRCDKGKLPFIATAGNVERRSENATLNDYVEGSDNGINAVSAPVPVEDQHALHQGSGFSVVDEGGVAMSRYPFMAAANLYLDAVKNVHKEATVTELRRRLNRMAKDFETLRERGIINDDDPRYLGEKGILAYL